MWKKWYPVNLSQENGLYMLQISIKPFEFRANIDLTNSLRKGPDALGEFLFILRTNLSLVTLDKCARWF